MGMEPLNIYFPLKQRSIGSSTISLLGLRNSDPNHEIDNPSI